MADKSVRPRSSSTTCAAPGRRTNSTPSATATSSRTGAPGGPFRTSRSKDSSPARIAKPPEAARPSVLPRKLAICPTLHDIRSGTGMASPTRRRSITVPGFSRRVFSTPPTGNCAHSWRTRVSALRRVLTPEHRRSHPKHRPHGRGTRHAPEAAIRQSRNRVSRLCSDRRVSR